MICYWYNKMSQLTGTVLAMTIAIILLLVKLLVPQSVLAINISGTSGDDLLTGSSGGSSSNQILKNNSTSTSTPNIRNDNQVQEDDFIYGGYGNDIIYGLNGSDHLSGGPGNDVIYVMVRTLYKVVQVMISYMVVMVMIR
jgi:Ca2+-binding RTX toxin-like protein